VVTILKKHHIDKTIQDIIEVKYSLVLYDFYRNMERMLPMIKDKEKETKRKKKNLLSNQ
jgi:hypothetical protein